MELTRCRDRVGASARAQAKLHDLAEQCPGPMGRPLDVIDHAAVLVTMAAIEAAHGPIELALLNGGRR